MSLTLVRKMKNHLIKVIGSVMLLTTCIANADYSRGAELVSEDRAYDQALLSPDGRHFAITAPIEGQAGMMIFNIASMQAVAAFNVEKNQDILKFWWANNERVVVNLSLVGATPDYPLLKGELFALNIDNTRKFAVAGFAAGDRANYEFLDSFSENKKQIRVVRSGIKNKQLDLTRPTAYTLDIYKRARGTTGTNMKAKRLENKYSSPYPHGGFVADNNGELRVAYDVDSDGNLKISNRDYDNDQWVEVENYSAPILSARQGDERPVVGFDAANKGIFYLGKSQYDTVGLFHVDVTSGVVTTLYEHEQFDINQSDLIYASDREIVGVNVEGTSSAQFFASSHAEVGRLKGLFNAFKGNRVDVVNYGRKGELALIDVHSEGVESGLYLFNSSNNSLSILMPASS